MTFWGTLILFYSSYKTSIHLSISYPNRLRKKLRSIFEILLFIIALFWERSSIIRPLFCEDSKRSGAEIMSRVILVSFLWNLCFIFLALLIRNSSDAVWGYEYLPLLRSFVLISWKGFYWFNAWWRSIVRKYSRMDSRSLNLVCYLSWFRSVKGRTRVLACKRRRSHMYAFLREYLYWLTADLNISVMNFLTNYSDFIVILRR